MSAAVRKLEGHVEDWWINSTLLEEGTTMLYGNFFGLESAGFEEGKFNHVPLVKADFETKIVEIDCAYLRLGEPNNMERVLENISRRVEESKGGEKK